MNNLNRRSFAKEIEKRVKEDAAGMAENSCKPIAYDNIVPSDRRYQYAVDEMKGFATLGSGRNDEWSNVYFSAKCCLKKKCCVAGSAQVTAQCKLLVTVEDKFNYG